eukprot:Em0016g555a
MAKFDVTLPEISVETFEHAWLSSEEKSSLEGVKAALTKRAGLKKDPLVTAKHFSSREQGEKESVRDYAPQLRKAFAEAYPKEDTVSAVLLQKFTTGLRASITRQMLLKGRPSTMEQAIEEAVVIEEALKFGGEVSEVNVNAIQKKEDSGELGQLKTLLEQMVKKIGSSNVRSKDWTEGHDYRKQGTISMRGEERRNVTDRVTPPCSDKVVVVSEDVQIPGHSILLLEGKIRGDEGRGWIGEGLIEEGDVDGKLKNMLVARSLSTVMEGNGVKLQVMNTGPMPIMLYKGMKIASFIPRQNIMFVGEGKSLERVTMSTATPKFNLEGTNLSGDEKRKLVKWLEEFKESFAEGNWERLQV